MRLEEGLPLRMPSLHSHQSSWDKLGQGTGGSHVEVGSMNVDAGEGEEPALSGA